MDLFSRLIFWFFTAGLIAFGVYALWRGELDLSETRQVRGTVARIVGALVLAAAGLRLGLYLGLLPDLGGTGQWLPFAILIAALMLGWILAERVPVRKKARR